MQQHHGGRARRSHEKGLYHTPSAPVKAAGRSVCAKLREAGVPLKGDGIWVREYIDDMPRCMAAADLVISRCGAMTLSELPAAGKASILIPSPNVAENHQYHNAMALVNRGAAVCIEEKDLTPDALWDSMEAVARASGCAAFHGGACPKGAILDASDRIYAVIQDVLSR